MPKQAAAVPHRLQTPEIFQKGQKSPWKQRCATGLAANRELGALSVPIVCLILTGAGKELSLRPITG